MMTISRYAEGRAKPQDDIDSGEDVPGIRTDVFRQKGLLTVDLDSFGAGAQKELVDEITKLNRLPLFEGKVEHGFSKQAAGSTDRCPCCGAATRQCTASFVYATNIAPRAMLAPAGYFCTSCPTVIIDEEMLAKGMKQGYRFRSVVGIDHDEKRFDLFTTWNGKKTICFLDENQQIMDMATEDELPTQSPPTWSRDRGKEKRKRKMERKARKRNRRK
jgi:hypothetical protein